MHNDFTLFKRKVPSGERVVYHYAYDGEGKRLGPWSTGETSLTAARNICNRLNREGKLLPGVKEIHTFAEFAAGFWDWEKSENLFKNPENCTFLVYIPASVHAIFLFNKNAEGAASGIAVVVEGETLTFKTDDKTASFLMLETAQILTNRTKEAEVIVTLAQNGGLQIKSRL